MKHSINSAYFMSINSVKKKVKRKVNPDHPARPK